MRAYVLVNVRSGSTRQVQARCGRLRALRVPTPAGDAPIFLYSWRFPTTRCREILFSTRFKQHLEEFS